MLSGQSRPLERLTAQHVVIVMAMKHPVAGALRNPPHGECPTWRGALGDDAVRRRGAIVDTVDTAVAATLDGEVETVEVHRMRHDRRVDDAEANGVADAVREPLR